MKKIILLILMIFAFISCTKNDKPNSQIIENTNVNTEKTEKIYVDVRTLGEWKAGHIDGAIHIPLDDIKSGKYDLIPKDKTVYVYCRSGNRSAQAIKILEEKWYKNLINAGWIWDLKNEKIIK